MDTNNKLSTTRSWSATFTSSPIDWHRWWAMEMPSKRSSPYESRTLMASQKLLPSPMVPLVTAQWRVRTMALVPVRLPDRRMAVAPMAAMAPQTARTANTNKSASPPTLPAAAAVYISNASDCTRPIDHCFLNIPQSLLSTTLHSSDPSSTFADLSVSFSWTHTHHLPNSHQHYLTLTFLSIWPSYLLYPFYPFPYHFPDNFNATSSQNIPLHVPLPTLPPTAVSTLLNCLKFLLTRPQNR